MGSELLMRPLALPTPVSASRSLPSSPQPSPRASPVVKGPLPRVDHPLTWADARDVAGGFDTAHLWPACEPAAAMPDESGATRYEGRLVRPLGGQDPGSVGVWRYAPGPAGQSAFRIAAVLLTNFQVGIVFVATFLPSLAGPARSR